MSQQADEILTFWFGKLPATQMRDKWFIKNEQFDLEIRVRFSEVYEKAAHQDLEAWLETASSSLALIILLDQFPRNMFRNSPKAFATDELALKYAKAALARGFDRRLGTVERMFFYLPFEHSENIGDQNEAVNQFAALAAADTKVKSTLDYAIRHREIIQLFGRFPHRNEILGRTSTAEEKEFLKSFPGF